MDLQSYVRKSKALKVPLHHFIKFEDHIPPNVLREYKSDEIKFFQPSKKWYEFSNFWTVEDGLFEWRGRTWTSSECAFQAAKFMYSTLNEYNEYVDLIQCEKNPGVAKMYGNQKVSGRIISRCEKSENIKQNLKSFKHLKLDPEWESKKVDIMKEILFQKFSQNEDLKNLLLSTENRHIVENSPYDRFWGVHKSGTGKNMLGHLLMDVRHELMME